jgi:hypothetical protein
LTGLGFWDTHIIASNTPIPDLAMEFGPYCGNKVFPDKWDEKTSKYTEGHIKVWERHDSTIVAYLRTRIHSNLSTSFTKDMTAKEVWDIITSVCKLEADAKLEKLTDDFTNTDDIRTIDQLKSFAETLLHTHQRLNELKITFDEPFHCAQLRRVARSVNDNIYLILKTTAPITIGNYLHAIRPHNASGSSGSVKKVTTPHKKSKPKSNKKCRTHDTDEHVWNDATCRELRGLAPLNKDKSSNYPTAWPKILSVQPLDTPHKALSLGRTTRFALDSGSSNHFTASLKGLSNYRSNPRRQHVTAANGGQLHIAGSGDISFSVDTQTSPQHITLHNIHHLPNLHGNLLSVSRFDREDHSVLFGGQQAWIIPGNFRDLLPTTIQPIAIARLEEDGLYYVGTNQDSALQLQALSIRSKCAPDFQLLHRRIGHLNRNDLKLLPSLCTDLQIHGSIYWDHCDPCIHGHSHRQPYPSNPPRKRDIGDLVIQDIKGPLDPLTYTGERYAQIFTERASGHVTLFLLKRRTETTNNYITYKNWLLTQTGHNIKAHQTDNAKEYLSKTFEDHLKAQGTKHRLTVPYAHAQNAVAERQNRTIENTALSMLSQANTPLPFWSDAMRTAA